MIESIVSAPAAALSRAGQVTVSVVSHGHVQPVTQLLRTLASQADPAIARVVVTHNLAGDGLASALPAQLPFALTELHNARPLGFGANHNRAFAHCATPLFCVLNPDVELLDGAIWQQLADAACAPGVGCAYPALLDPDGTVQDSEREAVTPASLWRRHVLRQREQRADWVSAAFWMVRAEAWRALGGFDERFRMYCEDVDFCLRLQLAGWQLRRVPARARHGAARASRRQAGALAMHLASLARLWLQPPLRTWLAARGKPRQ